VDDVLERLEELIERMQKEPQGNGNGWREWSRHILAEINRLDRGQERIESNQSEIQAEIATLTVKATIWGAIAGAIPATIAIVWILMTR
jgi:hypothetical protein